MKNFVFILIFLVPKIAFCAESQNLHSSMARIEVVVGQERVVPIKAIKNLNLNILRGDERHEEVYKDHLEIRVGDIFKTDQFTIVRLYPKIDEEQFIYIEEDTECKIKDLNTLSVSGAVILDSERKSGIFGIFNFKKIEDAFVSATDKETVFRYSTRISKKIPDIIVLDGLVNVKSKIGAFPEQILGPGQILNAYTKFINNRLIFSHRDSTKYVPSGDGNLVFTPSGPSQYIGGYGFYGGGKAEQGTMFSGVILPKLNVYPYVQGTSHLNNEKDMAFLSGSIYGLKKKIEKFQILFQEKEGARPRSHKLIGSEFFSLEAFGFNCKGESAENDYSIGKINFCQIENIDTVSKIYNFHSPEKELLAGKSVEVEFAPHGIAVIKNPYNGNVAKIDLKMCR